jgi:hypothetical protein
MRKVQALLDRADHPNTPEPEADSCRAKAESLMMKYRIEEEDLRAKGELFTETITPGSKIVTVCAAGSPYYNDYWTIANYVANHVGARIHYKWGVTEDNVYSLMAVVVGYEADIRFFEALYTGARLVFADRMEPKVDPRLSDEDNVYRLRSAGIERIKIARMMGYGETNSATAKVTNMYKRACKARGEDPVLTGRGTSVTAFKEQYSAGFLSKFHSRLWDARHAVQTGGTDLVLHNRKEAVDEAFYQLYPNMRPDNLPTVTTKRSRKSGWTAKDEARWRRAQSAGGQAGASAGNRAASEVNLGGSSARKSVE